MSDVFETKKITELSETSKADDSDLLMVGNPSTGELSKITKENYLSEINEDLSFLTTMNGMSHNALLRGKDLGTSVTDAQWEAISAGTFDDMYIGDYWTINGYSWIIADFDYWWRCGDSGNPLLKHNILMVPKNCISVDNTQMNDTDTTEGGYIGSQMYASGLDEAKNVIMGAFGSDHIVNHREYLTNAVTGGRPSGAAWVDSTVELMNEEMVYGCPIRQQMAYGGTATTTTTIDKSQLALFRLDRSSVIAMGDGNGHGLTSTSYNWWLRDVVSATTFAFVGNSGIAHYSVASSSYGVRPCFALC